MGYDHVIYLGNYGSATVVYRKYYRGKSTFNCIALIYQLTIIARSEEGSKSHMKETINRVNKFYKNKWICSGSGHESINGFAAIHNDATFVSLICVPLYNFTDNHFTALLSEKKTKFTNHAARIVKEQQTKNKIPKRIQMERLHSVMNAT